jgi:hypothetical protein
MKQTVFLKFNVTFVPNPRPNRLLRHKHGTQVCTKLKLNGWHQKGENNNLCRLEPQLSTTVAETVMADEPQHQH